MTRTRLCVRIASFFFFLILAEISARHIVSGFQPQNFNQAYRFPRGEETLYLPKFVEYIRNFKTPFPYGKIIVFSGSSPTYGHKIKHPQNTYPFTFEKTFVDNGARNIRVYNTASDGQLVSDQYFIIKSLIDTADIFYIQLNYHTFNPQTLRDTVIRHKEMPEMLGVSVTPSEAAVLNRRPTPPFPVNAWLQRALKKYSVLYGERETLAERLFGGKPEDALYKLYEKIRSIKFRETADALLAESTRPFSELKPAQQMVIVRRYGERCHFKIGRGNSEIFFLNEMLALLKKYNKPAVFFITPLNQNALDDYEVMNRKEYKKNVSVISRFVTEKGFLFLDFNAKHHYSEELFFDISHTLDEGGKIVGRDLFNDTKKYLEKNL